MSKMKKIVSLVLVIVMLSTNFVFAQAKTTGSNYDTTYFAVTTKRLITYIEKYGGRNKRGDYVIQKDYDDHIAIAASESDGLHFYGIYNTDSAVTTVEMYFDTFTKAHAICTYTSSSSYIDGYCSINTLKYDENNENIAFTFTSGRIPSGSKKYAKNILRLLLSMAFTSWKLLLSDSGMYISELGFAKYCPGHGQTLSYDSVKPTCKTAGVKHKLCAHCGLIIKTEKISAGEHVWNSGKVVKKPTCEKEGEMRYTCTVCGATKIQAIKKAEHTYLSILTPATTKKNGKIVSICSICGSEGKTKKTYRIESVILDKTNLPYDGTPKKPDVTVKDAKGKVISSDYYTVECDEDYIDIGTYSAQIIFQGLYKGKESCEFNIVPGRVTDLKAASKKTGVAKVAWSSVDGAQKYVIYCSATKKGGYQKVAVTNKTAYNIQGLDSDTTYYITIKALTQTGGKNYFSAVSNIAKVKVK